MRNSPLRHEQPRHAARPCRDRRQLQPAVRPSSRPRRIQHQPLYLSNYITLYPGQVAYNQNVGYIDSQSFNSVIDKLNFKHQFSASSFGEVRLFKTIENLIFRYPYDIGSFSGFYEDLATQGLGEGFDYNNQLSERHNFGIGGDTRRTSRLYSRRRTRSSRSASSSRRRAARAAAPRPATAAAISARSTRRSTRNAVGTIRGIGVADRAAQAPMKTFFNDAFRVVIRRTTWICIKDLYQPSDRFTADSACASTTDLRRAAERRAAQHGLLRRRRTSGRNYVRSRAPAPLGTDVTRPSQLSPRVALTYKINDRNVLRFSYGKNIEFEPESGIEQVYQSPPIQELHDRERLLPAAPGFGVTNHISNLYQSLLVDENTNDFQQYTPVRPQRAINYDASIEHDFGNGLQLKITPYYRKGTDYVVGSSISS